MSTENLFTRVAPIYDAMNNAMSLGMHHVWKTRAIQALWPIPPKAWVLDIACGSGDMTHHAQKIYQDVHCLMLDEAFSMLKQAQKKCPSAQILCADAHALPLQDACIHTGFLAFGLRNMQNPKQALSELYRVLEPGGQGMILEFHPPLGMMQIGFELYGNWIKTLGALYGQDRESYAYLVDSIQQYVQPHTLELWIQEAGFMVQKTIYLQGLLTQFHLHKEI